MNFLKSPLMWALACLMIASSADAGPVFIWYGDYAKNLATGGMVMGGTDEKQLADCNVDPSSGGGLVAPIGSIALCNVAGTGALYIKTGAGNTAWSPSVAPPPFSGTANRAVVTDALGALTTSSVTDTEVAYLSGVSSALCGINQSCTLTNKTLTSPVINSPTGIVKGDVGLGNVDNTSDATKDAATATLTNKTISVGSNTISGLGTSIVVVSDSGGVLGSSGVSSTELGYSSGVTSSLCGINQTCTLTNKSIDGLTNTLTNIPSSALTFPLIGPDGSVTAPTYAFSESGNDTGLFHTGDGNISFAANGQVGAELNGAVFSVKGINGYIDANKVLAAEFGTETASNVTLKANNVTKMTLIDGNEVASSFTNVVPVDNVGGNQFYFQTDVSPNVGTTNANRTGMYNFMNVDGAATGYPLNGNYIATGARVQHSGDGALGYASASDNSAYFAANGGSVGGFKGYNMDTQFGAGYNINAMSNYFSSVNTTGGIVGNLESYGSNVNLNDASVGNSSLFNGNLNIGGTSTLSGGINGVTANLQLADSADGTGQNMNGLSFNGSMSGTTKIGGMNAVGANVQMTDSAQNLGGVNLGNFSLDCRDSSVCNGINGVSTNIQVRNSATANGVTYGNFFGSTDGTAVLSNVNGLSSGANFGGSSSISGVQMLSTNGYLHDSAHIDNYSGGVIGLSMGGTSTVTNFQPFNINAQIQDTAVVTNSPTLMNVNLSTYSDALPGLTGIQVNLGGASLSPAALASGQQKVGLNVNDGILNSYSQYSNDGFTGTGAVLHNNLGGQYSIGAGHPVSNQYHFLNFIGWNVAAEDDFNDDGLGVGLGLSINGLANQVAVAAGKTIKDMNYMMAGGSTPPGSAGSITNLAMFRALGILPAGGTVSITNLYGFKADPVMDYAGATNTFGVYVGATTADNYFSKSVTIGQEKTTNSDIALEIGSAKATMLGAMDTTARNALTAVERMMIYNTTTQQYEFYNGTVWGPMAGASSPLTTKGDLYGFDTGNARVPVGTDGQVLTADSGAALGVSWQTPSVTGITELTGDVTAGPGTGSQAATIATSAVTNSKLADMAQATVKGRAAGAGTGAPVDLSQTQLTELVNSFTSSLSGAAPASGGGTTNFLRADGTWAAPSGSGDVSGPGSSVNNNVVFFNGTTGKIIKDSGLTLSGSNTGDVTIGTANGLSLAGQALSLALSSTSTTGALSSTDWNTFNGKQSALTIGNLTSGTTGVTVTGGTGAVIGSGASISVQTASGSQPGLLSSTDWNTFNDKVTGQASSVDSEVALFSGTGGKTIKRATGTGFAKLTSGVLSTSSTVNAATELTGITPVANGGTGASSLTANNVILGNGTSAVQAVAPGTSGNILTSNGTTWSSAAPASVSLTSGVSGILPLANGGTNANLTAVAGGVTYSGASALAISAAGTSGQPLLSGGTGAPTFGTLSATAGGTAQTTYTTGDTLYSSASNTLSKLGIGTTGQVLTVAGGVPTWATPASGGALSVSSKSANYTVTTSDDVLLGDASSASFTFTLYTCTGNSGKVLRIKKTDSTSNTVTIDANASETIDGALTFVVNIQNQAVELICNGTNWFIF